MILRNLYNGCMKKHKIKFTREVICFTGKSPLTRFKMESLARAQGATVVKQVTQKTTLLVMGVRSGSKLDRAYQLGVDILPDEVFLKMIGWEAK